MSTTINCIAKERRQTQGNHIHRLLRCDSLCTSKTIRTVHGDINTTEVLYQFKDGSQIRLTDSKGRLLFIASKGPNQ